MFMTAIEASMGPHKMWKHHVPEGEGELEAAGDLDQGGAEPAGGSLA